MQIELFGIPWQIEVTSDKKELMVNGKFCKGAVHYKDATIFIYKDTSSKDRMRLLLHEISHVVLYETQIELKENYTEEDMCEFMAKYGMMITSIVQRLDSIIYEGQIK